MLSLLERDIVVSVAMGEARSLFDGSSAPHHRAPVAARVVSSLMVHGAVAAILFTLINLDKPHAPKPFLTTPRLVSVVYLPSAPVDLPKMNLPAVRAPKEAIAPEPATERAPLLPVRPIETAAVETPIVRHTPAVVEAARPPAPVPAPPSPTVGSFPEATAAARAPQPTPRRVEVAGFDAPVKQSTESQLGQATVGAFDSAPAAGARQAGSTKAESSVVAESGFGRPSASAPPTQQTRVLRDGGFGESAARARPTAAEPPAELKPAGFASGLATEAPRRAAAAPAAPKITPVEVISKPTPVYTEQARKLKIEGEVILEVEFSASGSLRVVRVVRGLGYGLDEAAMKAAEQIQFKPAMSQGRAVDYRANVHIVFRHA